MPLRPLQQPYPPFWYGSSNEIGFGLGRRTRTALRDQRRTQRAKQNITAFKQAYAKRGNPASPRADVPGRHRGRHQPADCRRRHRRGGAPHRRRPSPIIISNLLYLWRLNIGDDLAARQNVPIAGTFEDALKEGTIIAGSPQTVRAEIEKQIAELGINYPADLYDVRNHAACGCAALAAAVQH